MHKSSVLIVGNKAYWELDADLDEHDVIERAGPKGKTTYWSITGVTRYDLGSTNDHVKAQLVKSESPPEPDQRKRLLTKGHRLLEATATPVDQLAQEIDVWRHEVATTLADGPGTNAQQFAAFEKTEPPGRMASEFATKHDNDHWLQTYQTSLRKALISLQATPANAPGEDDEMVENKKQNVMVIHGRNTDAQRAMFAFLRSIGLKPMEFSKAVTGTGKTQPYIGEVLGHLLDEAQAVVALLTPDEIAYLRTDYKEDDDDPDLEPRGQSRPNVLFEAGMAMGRMPDRTVLVEMGKLRKFTDVDGIHTVRITNDFAKRQDLANRLKNADCPVDLDGTDWHDEGDFTPPTVPKSLGKRLPSTKTLGAAVKGRWISRGGSTLDEVKLTNTGAVDLYTLELQVPENLSDHVQLNPNVPTARLPVGETTTVRAWTTSKTLAASSGPDQFELRAVGQLDDGTAFEQMVYFDAG